MRRRSGEGAKIKHISFLVRTRARLMPPRLQHIWRTSRQSHLERLSLPSLSRLVLVVPGRCHSLQGASCFSCCWVQTRRWTRSHLLSVSHLRCRSLGRRPASCRVVSVQCARGRGRGKRVLRLVSGPSIHHVHSSSLEAACRTKRSPAALASAPTGRG